MQSLQGVGVSSGIAIGRAFVYRPEMPVATFREVDDPEGEIERLRGALRVAKEQLGAIRRRAAEEVGEETAAIFDAHAMFLDDPEFVGQIESMIRTQAVAADYSVQETVRAYAAIFAEMEDEYMRARGTDIIDVGRRLLLILAGREESSLAELSSPVIVVAHDLTPSDTARMNKKMVMGFATEVGGKTSHTAIMARILGIPAAISLGPLLEGVTSGDTLILDGKNGTLVLDASDAALEEYRERQGEHQRRRREFLKSAQEEAVTVDGQGFEVAANIGDVESARTAVEAGANGVGLLRTEFLYLNRAAMPGEEEQYLAYSAIGEAMGDRPVVIRTLDIGGDKQLPYLEIGEEDNPFLGWRAIRYCLDRPDVFRTQLRAILRAGARHDFRVMFPMIATLDELRRAREVLDEAKDELRTAGIEFDSDMSVGIMIEIPAAALAADVLAREVDFFSIGTNDLIQYTMACDRGNERVGYLYDPLHPTVLRLVREVIAAGHRHGKHVGMCGEMAGDPEAIPLLVGMKLDLLSMNASSIPEAKAIIRALDSREAGTLVDAAMECTTADEVRKLAARLGVR